MENYGWLIILLWGGAKLSAQQSEYVSQTKYTRIVNTINLVADTSLSDEDYSLEEFEVMVKRCNELAVKLVEYKALWDSEKVAKKQKRAWEKDIVEAKLLNFRIEDFITVYLKNDPPILEYIHIQLFYDFDSFSRALEGFGRNIE